MAGSIQEAMGQAVSQKVDPDDLNSAADAFQQKTGRAPTDEDKTKLGLALLARGGDVDAAVSAAAQPPAATTTNADPNVKNLNDWANVGASIANGVSSAASTVGDALSSMGRQGADALRADMDAGYAGDVQVVPGKPRSIKSAVSAPADPAPADAPAAPTAAGLDMGSTSGATEPADDFVHANASDRAAAQSVAERIRDAGGAPSPGTTGDGIPWSIAVQTIAPGHIQTPKDINAQVDGLTAEEGRFEKAIGAKPGESASTISGEEQKIISDWKEKKETLTNTFNVAKEKLGWMEALSLISSGLARLGAGLYGMRTGVDTSGLKFDYYDWSKDYGRLIDEFNMKLGQAEKEKDTGLQRTTQQKQEFRDIRDRLAGAQGERAHMETQIAEGNARMGQEAAQFNAGQANEGARTTARFNFDYDQLGRQLDANLKMANGRNVLEAAREDYKLQAADYQKKSDDFRGGVATVGRIAAGDVNLSDPKEKANVDQAFRSIGAFINDPNLIAELEQGNKTGLFTRDKVAAQNFLNKLKELPPNAIRQPPTYHDYSPGSAWYRMATGVSGGAPANPAAPTAAGSQQKYPPGTKAKDLQGNPVVMGADGQWQPAPAH